MASPADPQARAALAAARARVGQATSQLRKVAQNLAAADQGFYAAASIRVTDPHGVRAAADRIEAEHAEHGAIDVIVLIPDKAPQSGGADQGEEPVNLPAPSQGFNADKRAKQRRQAPITIGGVEFRRRRVTNSLNRSQTLLARKQEKLNRQSKAKQASGMDKIGDDLIAEADELFAEADELGNQASDVTYELIADALNPNTVKVSSGYVEELAGERALEAAEKEAEGVEARAKALAKDKLPEMRKAVEAEAGALAAKALDTEGNPSTEFLAENLEIPEALDLMAWLSGVSDDEDAEQRVSDEDPPTQGT